MNTYIFLWKIGLEVRWDYHEPGEGNIEEYNVAAKNYQDAISKAAKVALKVSRKWVDEQEDGTKLTHLPIEVVDVTNIERGELLGA